MVKNLFPLPHFKSTDILMTQYSQLNSHDSMLTIQYSRLNTHYSILITQYSRLNTHYSNNQFDYPILNENSIFVFLSQNTNTRMQTIGVETTQNVLIKQEVANVGERIASQLIDYIIMIAYIVLLAWISGELFSAQNQDVFVVLMLFPVFFYSLLSETFLQGQSLGKKVLKIKVVKIDGSSAGFGNYLVRWMFRLIDVNFLYGIVAIITIAVNGKGQRLGDMVAKTCVINLRKSKKIDDTIYVEVPDAYKLVYPEVELLNDDDIKTVKDVIGHYKKNVTNAIAVSMLRQTVDAVKKKTGIENNEIPMIFLETVLADYNFIHKTDTTKQ